MARWWAKIPAGLPQALQLGRHVIAFWLIPLHVTGRVSAKPVLYNEVVCQVSTLLTLLNGTLQKAVQSNDVLTPQQYERVFLYCLAWSLGGLLDQRDRPAFDAQLRNLSSELPPKVPPLPRKEDRPGCRLSAGHIVQQSSTAGVERPERRRRLVMRDDDSSTARRASHHGSQGCIPF